MARTTKAAVAGAPDPPLLDATFEVIFVCAPAAVAVTFTEKVQDEFAATVPPVRLMLFVPAMAVITPAPQLPVRPFGVDTAKPTSKSVNATPDRATVAFEFEMRKVSVVDPPSGMDAAPNDFVMDGGPTTVIPETPGLPRGAFVEVTGEVELN